VADHRSILKNNQNTYFHRFSFTLKTGVEVPEMVFFSFYRDEFTKVEFAFLLALSGGLPYGATCLDLINEPIQLAVKHNFYCYNAYAKSRNKLTKTRKIHIADTTNLSCCARFGPLRSSAIHVSYIARNTSDSSAYKSRTVFLAFSCHGRKKCGVGFRRISENCMDGNERT